MKHSDKLNFDGTWRAMSAVRKAAIKECDDFLKLHYLGKRPAIVMLALIAEANGNPMGCIVYSAAPRESAKRYGGITWEMARLFMYQWVPRNGESWLIGRSVKYIKRHYPEVKTLVTYADHGRRGHTGAIYKAANWTADGSTDDNRKTPRNDLMDPKTGKIYGRWSAAPPGSVKVPRDKKFRFIYTL